MHVPINLKFPDNINEWQKGVNSAFKGLNEKTLTNKDGLHNEINSVSNSRIFAIIVPQIICPLVPYTKTLTLKYKNL